MFDYFLCIKDDKQPDMSLDELTELRFPKQDFEKVYEDLRELLTFVHLETAPRSRAAGGTISYGTLASYRDSRLYWVKSSYEDRCTVSPPHALVRLVMTGAIVYAVRDDPREGRREKVFIGLSELRQLFDYEMEHNLSILNAEQHQAICVLARLTACRPGSLYVSGKHGRAKPLPWQRLTFSRQDENGRFDVRVQFDDVHIKDPNNPDARNKNRFEKSLTVLLFCPDSQNIVFLAAHRFLTLALRCGY